MPKKPPPVTTENFDRWMEKQLSQASSTEADVLHTLRRLTRQSFEEGTQPPTTREIHQNMPTKIFYKSLYNALYRLKDEKRVINKRKRNVCHWMAKDIQLETESPAMASRFKDWLQKQATTSDGIISHRLLQMLRQMTREAFEEGRDPPTKRKLYERFGGDVTIDQIHNGLRLLKTQEAVNCVRRGEGVFWMATKLE